MDIKEVLESHKLWINGDGGIRANLRGVDLSGVDLHGVDLSDANLSGANLHGADLRGVYLYRADLRNANLSGASLSGSASSGVNFSRANLSGADLSRANLSEANLSRANLSEANLSDADLSDADLSNADLRRADLRSVDLSGVGGLLSAKDFLSQFKRDKDGAIICYKTFNSTYAAPDAWQINDGQFIAEVCNPNRTDEWGCGINVSTIEWVEKYENGTIWECRILPEDFADIVVPYNTDGNFRTERVQLVGVVE